MRKVYSDTDIRDMVAGWWEEIRKNFLKEPVFYKLLEGTQSPTERRQWIEDYVKGEILYMSLKLIEENARKVLVSTVDGRHEFNSAEEFRDWILSRKEHYGISAWASDLENTLKKVESRIDNEVRNFLGDIFHDSLVLSAGSDIYPGLYDRYIVFAEKTKSGHSLFQIFIKEGSSDAGPVYSDIVLGLDLSYPAEAFNKLPDIVKEYVGYLIARVIEEYRELYPLERGTIIKDEILEKIAYEEGVKGVLRELQERKLSLRPSMGV